VVRKKAFKSFWLYKLIFRYVGRINSEEVIEKKESMVNEYFRFSR
jgi:hypothetical protein